MSKKSLVLYASQTGNTEKVALRFKKVFEKYDWKCDIFKITGDINFYKLPFDYTNYDFLCIGSPTKYKSTVDEMKNILVPPPPPDHVRQAHANAAPTPIKPVELGPAPKKGIVFATYGGLYYGPNEVGPVLSFMGTTMEMYLKFKCVGSFACPGKYPAHMGWYKDLNDRPSERDLLKAEIFLEETIEDNYINIRYLDKPGSN
jgi:hypothetical protein